MDSLDTPTLLQVNAAFNAMAAVAWLLLAVLFRVAPSAGRLMAAAHLARIVSQGCGDCLAGGPALLQQALAPAGTLACLALLLLALRRMLRSRQRPRDVALIGGVGAAGVVGGLLAGTALLPQLASAGAVAALAVLCTREMLVGVARQVSRVVTAFMVLPFAALTLVSALHLLALAGDPARHLLGPGLSAPWRAVLWLLLSAAITLSLIALMIWRLVSRIQHLMRHDALTGALNRRAFERTLADHQALLQRGHGFAVVMMDIDHFKRINDRLGHAAGDAALQHTVRLWRAELREVDPLGRMGGEEFCALLPLAHPGDLTGAVRVAERLREALAAAPLVWRGEPVALTASFGVALPALADPAGDTGLARADAQLYRAKAEGRNRVCAAADAAAPAAQRLARA